MSLQAGTYRLGPEDGTLRVRTGRSGAAAKAGHDLLIEVTEKDEGDHRAVLAIKSREAGGQGHANATVTFALADGGGNIHTNAQNTGKAASMGEGVVAGVLDALITDFTTRLGDI